MAYLIFLEFDVFISVFAPIYGLAGLLVFSLFFQIAFYSPPCFTRCCFYSCIFLRLWSLLLLFISLPSSRDPDFVRFCLVSVSSTLPLSPPLPTLTIPISSNGLICHNEHATNEPCLLLLTLIRSIPWLVWSLSKGITTYYREDAFIYGLFWSMHEEGR